MDNLIYGSNCQFAPPSTTTRIMVLKFILILFLSDIVNSQKGRNSESLYNSGIQYSAYGGGKSFPSHNIGYGESLLGDAPEAKSEGRSAKRNEPQQVVDESMVAQMMKNPDAMKMVLKYLTKQNLNEHQKKWDKMAKSKSHGKNKHTKASAKKPTTTLKPKVTTTTKKAKTKSPIIQITQIKRRNDDGKKTHKNKEKQKNKRRPRPPGGDFFDLAQLFASLGSKGNNRKKAEKGKENEKQRPPDLSFLFGPPLRNGKPKKQKPSPRPTPPANVDELKNPQLLGDKPKLQYFGPSDFVPQHPYALPMKQHGPMKLTYMSAQEFPNIPKYGLIPIPRRR